VLDDRAGGAADARTLRMPNRLPPAAWCDLQDDPRAERRYRLAWLAVGAIAAALLAAVALAALA
jgi:hypothetical protein